MIARPPRRVLFIGIAIAFSLLGDQALYAVLPIYFNEIGLAPIHVGLILSANRWIRLLTNPLAERLTSRYNSAFLLTASLILGALITLIYASFSLFPVLLLARMLWGLCWSFLRQIGIMTSVRSSKDKNIAQVMGYYNGLSRIGSVVGLLIGGVMFDLIGFSPTFILLGIVSLLGVPLGSVSQKRLKPFTKSSSWFKKHSGSKRRVYGLLVRGFVLGCVGSGLIMATLGAILANIVGSSIPIGKLLIGVATLNGFLLAARWIFEILCAPFLGALTDRMGHRIGSFVFFGIGTMSLFACGIVSNILVLSFLILIFFVCGTTLTAVLAAEAGKRGSKTIALYASAWDFGAAIGPLLGWTILAIIFSPNLIFTFGGSLYFIASFVSGLALKEKLSYQPNSH